MKINKQSFLRRLAVITILHLMVKQGDLTFSSAFEPTLRSLFFSIYFIVYWMLFWEVCSIIFRKLMKFSNDRKVWYRSLSVITIVLLSLEVICSVIFGWLYRIFDLYLFRFEWIEDIHFINPDIFDPSDLFETFNINPEMLFGFILLFALVYGTHIFITSMKNVKELEIVAARKNKESITAQYTALKNQIDPHFFFNSLSVLSSLIYESTALSSTYISHLSKHYRYILEMNTESLVPVSRELEYLESYYFLIRIRHQDYINVSVDLSENTRTKCKVLPHALMMLVENAVKHNIFKKEDPLTIEIREDEGYIIARNNVNKRRLLQESTGIGLQNISRRYAIESNKAVQIEEFNNTFIVKLPKII